MVASVIVNCEPLIALTKIEKNKSNTEVRIFVSIMFQQTFSFGPILRRFCHFVLIKQNI